MTAPLDVSHLLRELKISGVDHVLIGGLAVNAHAVIRSTKDIDICRSPDADNLERLAAPLRRLGVRQLGVSDDGSAEHEPPFDRTRAEDLSEGGKLPARDAARGAGASGSTVAASHRTEREDPPSPPALLFVVCGAMRTRALRTVEPSRTAPNTACRTRGHAVLPRWSWHPIFARVPGGALCDLCVVSLARAVLRRCLAALIEHRLKRRSADTAELDELQTDAPLIAEVEHIRDRLADIEA